MSWYTNPEWWLCILGFFTLFFLGWQSWETRKATEAAVATVYAGTDASKRELRAYIAVVVGSATHQQRREAPQADLKFERSPLMVNTGRTPARKIKFLARAAILSVPLPKDAILLESTNSEDEGTILGSQQSANMYAVVDGFSPHNDVSMIKDGSGEKGLYVWGLITYEDAFGESHYTRFCHHVFWTVEGDTRGFYIPGRNDAD